MATTLFGWRPSALPVACPSVVSTPADIRLTRLVGLPQFHVNAVDGWRGLGMPPLPTWPSYVPGVGTFDNSIGTPAAVPATAMAAEGAVQSELETLSALQRSQQIDADKAKGFGARGNPPRGRRRV